MAVLTAFGELSALFFSPGCVKRHPLRTDGSVCPAQEQVNVKCKNRHENRY